LEDGQDVQTLTDRKNGITSIQVKTYMTKTTQKATIEAITGSYKQTHFFLYHQSITIDNNTIIEIILCLLLLADISLVQQ